MSQRDESTYTPLGLINDLARRKGLAFEFGYVQRGRGRNLQFEVMLTLGLEKYTAVGKTKKEAKQKACAAALDRTRYPLSTRHERRMMAERKRRERENEQTKRRQEEGQARREREEIEAERRRREKDREEDERRMRARERRREDEDREKEKKREDRRERERQQHRLHRQERRKEQRESRWEVGRDDQEEPQRQHGESEEKWERVSRIRKQARWHPGQRVCTIPEPRRKPRIRRGCQR